MVERRSPKPNAGGSSPSTPASLVAGLLLAALAALPFAFAVRPQMADYPSHLARYHVMLDQGRSAFLSQYYSFEWALRGNLGVDLLMVPLGGLLGVERAAWLIALLLPVLVALGILAVESTLRGRIGVGALLALATVWSPAMAMGFANFSLSLALALLAFALWVRLADKPWRAALFVLIGLLVWLSHSAGWGLLGVMVFGYEWHRSKSWRALLARSWRALLAPWPLFPPFLLMIAEPGAGSGLNYGQGVVGYKLAMWIAALGGTTRAFDLFSVLVLVLAILLALRFRAIDGRLGWAALLVALLTLAMPRHFGGGDFADLRLVPVALMLGCLSIDARVPRWVLWLAPLLFVLRVGLISAEWRAQSARLEATLPALELVPQGARIAVAVPYDPGNWGNARLSHSGSYATVYRDALVNTHFAIPGVHMLTVRGLGAQFSDPSQRVVPKPGEPVDLSRFPPAAHAQFLWYIGEIPVGRLPAGATVIFREPGSLLARLAKPQARR